MAARPPTPGEMRRVLALVAAQVNVGWPPKGGLALSTVKEVMVGTCARNTATVNKALAMASQRRDFMRDDKVRGSAGGTTRGQRGG